MSVNTFYLPKMLNFTFCRINPIISVYWEAPILYYYNKCTLYHSKFEEKNHFKKGKVTENDWLDFWQSLDKINVWSWDSEYNYRGIKFYENSNWHLYIVYQEKIITSIGKNSYPPSALSQPTEIFIELLNTFIKLGNSIY